MGRAPWWRGARGEWWVAAQVLLFAITAAAPRAGPPWVAPVPGSWLALVLGLAGVALIAAGAAALGSSLTIFPAPRHDGRFVRDGVYRYIRHPIYAGVMLLAVAWALYRNSLLHAGLAAVIVGFFAAKASREERRLAARFPEYAAYRRATRRFLPRIY